MKEEIKKFFKGDAEDDEATLQKYSRDASLLEVRPQLVLFPHDSEDIKNLVKWVFENKEKYPNLSITPRCAGTDMSGGVIGESIILDFTRHMNKLVGGPLPLKTKSTWEIAVQPGMFYRDFEKIVSAKGLVLPCFTASKSLNAIGGMYGSNSAGERTLKHGQTENFVLSAKVVLSDGNEYLLKSLSKNELEKKIKQEDFEGKIYRNIFHLIGENREEIKRAKPKVRKNASGYYLWNVLNDSSPESFFDLNKLLAGSQGTLGIATEITLKLIPENKHSELGVVFMKDLKPLGRVIEEILTLSPETLEVYDDRAIKLAVKFFPQFLRRRGILGILKLIWNFIPEFLMFLTGGFPKLIILAEFAGQDAKAVKNKIRQLPGKMDIFGLKTHLTGSVAEAEKYKEVRRESFELLRKNMRGLRTAPFVDDVVVRPEFLPKFLPELHELLKKYKIIYSLMGHAGDGNFHIIPLMDFKRKDTAEIILELGEKVYDLVFRYHGSITAEHNDGLIRTPYISKMYEPEIVEIFKKVKNIFDPKNIFNPGKKISLLGKGGTKEYLKQHIVQE